LHGTPTDWSDLTIYGLYAIEAAVLAAAVYTQQPVKKTHWDKRDVADRLHESHGLPDVSELMDQLNEARKATAYGDVEFPGDLDAEDIAVAIEDYVQAVAELLEAGP
jgi:hypothetical protein